MTLWTVLALLSVVLLLLHCNDSATAKIHNSVATTPRITSSRDLINLTSNLRRELQRVEKSLTPLVNQERKLQQAFERYSTRTARHGWGSPANRRQQVQHIRQDAIRLRSIAELVQKQLNTQYAKQIHIVQAKNLNRFRDGKVSNQIEQTANVYKRIVELLMNMIECPIYILAELGGEGESSEPIVPTTTIESPEFDYGEYK